MKLVSVIIPAFNEEKYIGKCLDSLKKQSYKPIKIIVVDDGSIDKTIKIVKKFNIKILRQKHQGPGIARNLGARNARGEILIFIDADMEFDKNYIRNLVKPILDKKVFGTIHQIEKVANSENIWAKCWGERPTVDKDNKGLIYRAITKKAFFRYGPFNPKKGYADDQTLYENSGIKAQGVNAICYHNNPSSLREVFIQSKWIGSSYKFKILEIPVLNFIFAIIAYSISPLYVIYLTVKNSMRKKDIYLIIFYPVFGIVKYTGSFIGLLKKIFLNKNVK